MAVRKRIGVLGYEGRYNPDSEINRAKKYWEPLLKHDDEPWLPGEDDGLLECFLVRRLTSYYGYRESYARYLGRSHRAVPSRAWKLVANYEGGVNYRPGPGRSDRCGAPFTGRDRVVFLSLFNREPIANGCLRSPEPLAALLARGVGEVELCAAAEARRHGSITEPAPARGEGLWEWSVRVVRRALRNGRRVNFSLGAS